MAEGGGNWWSNWLNSAKQTSSNVFEFMKKDLDEFSQTVQQETRPILSSVSHVADSLKEKLNIDKTESAANKVKRSMSSFLGSVSQVLTPEKPENEDEMCVIHNNEPVVMDRLQAQMYTLQSDCRTYLEDPKEDDGTDSYVEWAKKFDLDSRSMELSDILVTNIAVQEMYSKLVPSLVSHVSFWHRYFYKMNQVLVAEERKRELLERANQGSEEIVWDDIVTEEGFGAIKEVPDHVADQLLADYAKECEDRKLSLKNEPQVASSCSKDSGISETVVIPPAAIALVTQEGAIDVALSETGSVPQEEDVEDPQLVTREKGDLVVVGPGGLSNRTSPTSSNRDDEWVKDFEVEEDAKKPNEARLGTKDRTSSEGDDEWESWETD